MTDGIKRRDFLKVLGVTGAGAGLAGCSTEGAERLLPYVTSPEDIVPGVASWYTTACNGCSANCGMWVRVREGRIVKVEGNPNHPVSQGALCSRGHASLQHLYNADRFEGPMLREGGTLRPIGWDEAERMLAERIQAAGGNVRLVHGQMGPTLSSLADEFLQSVGGSRTEFQALSQAPLREAARIAFGVDALPGYDFEAADFVISLGGDFLEVGASPVEYGRGFARFSGARDDGHKGRFVFAGPRLSLTGLNADEWLPIRPGSEAALALGMASALGGGDAAGPYASLLQSYDVSAAARATGLEERTILEMAEAFAAGPSLAVGPGVGAHHRNATAAHLAALVLNSVAGNVGTTVRLQAGPASAASRPYADMQEAIRAMAGGQVGVAMVHGTNPAYELPPASGFVDAFSSVGFKVSFASAPDETAALADLILPDRHFLESWGDSIPKPGWLTVQQPAMRPLPHFDAKQTGDVLLSVASLMGNDLGSPTFYEYLREQSRALHGDDATFEDAWRQALREGGVQFEEAPSSETPAALRTPDSALTFDAPALDGDGDLTLLVHASSRFGAGEFANSPWQLELPDPVSKIMWHSWLEMNPATAEARGLVSGDVVRVESPHGAVEVPVWVYPGIREDSVALSMGLGHTDFGRYATGQGVNAMTLLPAAAEQPSGALVTVATTVTVAPTGERRRLVTTEGSSDQRDRPIAPAVMLSELGHGAEDDHAVDEATADADYTDPTVDAEGDHAAEEDHGEEGGHGELQELQAVGGFVPVDAHGGDPSAYPLEGAQHGEYADAHEGPRYGMAIDLDKCTGCSACVTACNAENNIPWVGEDQALMGRELHWMRIERYYEHVDATHASHLDVRFLPMMCQHCGNAPCEPVCPVYATYHTPEGVNSQVYNRCVGTRYCANNCPYKVRVYNWYRYTDDVPEPMNWQWNPDVTVRSNGIMEKCSLCMQRIRDAENEASLEGRTHPRDGDIKTACEQSCPAEAIVFGDYRDPDSRISHMYDNERTYRVLDDLINTQPGVSYLKKVTFHEVSGGH